MSMSYHYLNTSKVILAFWICSLSLGKTKEANYLRHNLKEAVHQKMEIYFKYSKILQQINIRYENNDIGSPLFNFSSF